MKRSRGAMYGTEVSSMNVLILTSDEFWFCGPFQVSCGKYPGPIWALHLEWQQDQRVILNILSRVRHFCITLISAHEITWEATTESPWERIWSAHGHEHSRKSWDCSVTWQTDYSIQIRRCTSWTQPLHTILAELARRAGLAKKGVPPISPSKTNNKLS